MGEYKGVLGGVTSMVASRFVPWHTSANKDRVKLTDLAIESGEQALVMAGCDWNVIKLSLGEFMPEYEAASDYVVTIRSDRQAVLGCGMSATYTEIQNQRIADLANAVLKAYPGASIESAGALFDPGQVVWMLVRLPEATVRFGTDGSEMHERYVLISTSHNGTRSLIVQPTDVRVECMNTISMAWGRTKAEFTIRHTAQAEEMIEEARRALGMAKGVYDEMDREIARLLDVKVDDADFLVDMVPVIIGERPEEEGKAVTNWERKFDTIHELWTADHNEAIHGTGWGVVNAANELEMWAVKPRGQTVEQRQMGMLLRADFPLTRKALALVS